MQKGKTAVGQHIITGFHGTKVPKELTLAVKEGKTGNFILFAENLATAAQIKALCKELTNIALGETGVAPLIAIDQEGGRVQRLPKDILTTPSAREIAETGDENFAFETGRRIGETLREFGINYNLAPVVDVESVLGNPSVGNRSFGSDSGVVCRFACAMIRGFNAGGVACCAKHFPGHGGTKVDSHHSLPQIDLTVQQLEAGPLVPFKAAMAAGVNSIMTTHIMFGQIDDKYPATLSKKVLKGLLRENLGFNGVITTDCLEMGAIAKTYGVEEAALLSIEAGADMLTISHDCTAAKNAAKLIGCVYERGDLNERELEESLERIMGVKAWLHL